MYPASARTRGGPALPVSGPPVIGGWTMRRSRAGDVIGRNPQSLNKPGRGGASSGRDTTARLFQSRQTPSLASFFFLFTRFCSLLLTKLRVHDYRYSGYKSASYIWWRKAFRSCRPQLQIFQQGGSCPYFKEVFISRGPADSQAKPTEFSFALVGGPRQRYIRGRNFVSYKEIQSKDIASEPKILLKIK